MVDFVGNGERLFTREVIRYFLSELSAQHRVDGGMRWLGKRRLREGHDLVV